MVPKILDEMRKNAKYDTVDKRMLVSQLDSGKTLTDVNELQRRLGRSDIDPKSADNTYGWVKGARRIGGDVGRILENEILDGHIASGTVYSRRKKELLFPDEEG